MSLPAVQLTIPPSVGPFVRIAKLSRHPLARRLAHGAFWSVISSGVGQGGALLASMAIARFLGATDFGKLGVILATVNLFVSVGAAGLGITATKYIAEYRLTDPDRAGRVIGLSSFTAAASGIFAGIMLLALAPWVARDILLAPQMVYELRISAVILLFASYNGYQAGALAGFEAFRSIAAANLIRGLCGLPILVAGAFFWGLPGAVFANGVVTLVSCAAHAYMLRNQCQSFRIRVSYSLRFEEYGLLFKFSVPVVLSCMSWAAAGWYSNAVLARACGFRENGLFQVGVHWQTIGLFLSNAVASVGLPMLSNSLDSRRRYLRILAGNAGLMIGLNMLIAVPAIVFAPWIAKIYGHGYSDAEPVIRIMCVGSLLLAANTSIQHIIWSLGRAKEGMFFGLLRAAALVAAASCFASHGARGLAWAYLLTTLLLNVIQVPFVIFSIRKIVANPSGTKDSWRPAETSINA